MRRIKNGKAYDTETGDLIVERGGDERDEWIHRLYRTREGAYFLYESGPQPGEQPDEYYSAELIRPLTDEAAKQWLERNANPLVEKYFGEVPEAGAAERRFTLRTLRQSGGAPCNDRASQRCNFDPLYRPLFGALRSSRRKAHSARIAAATFISQF